MTGRPTLLREVKQSILRNDFGTCQRIYVQEKKEIEKRICWPKPKCQDHGYLTLLLDPTQVESKNTIVKSNGLSRVLMLNLWIFSLEKNKIRKLWLK